MFQMKRKVKNLCFRTYYVQTPTSVIWWYYVEAQKVKIRVAYASVYTYKHGTLMDSAGKKLVIIHDTNEPNNIECNKIMKLSEYFY